MAGLSSRLSANAEAERLIHGRPRPMGDAAPKSSPFLTAGWRNLAVLNFDVDPAVLEPLLPHGVELDFWQGRTFLSLVGFQFVDTRVLGIAIPFHRQFAEVNLRYYVRRKTADGWRRSVVFLRELAPRRAVAWTARLLFGENYLTVPMRHEFQFGADERQTPDQVAYRWRHRRRDYELSLSITGEGSAAPPGSLEEFIIEHFWGCSGGPGRSTTEYRVEHPRWKLWPTEGARFQGDAEALYGECFAAALSAEPTSAFFADGSPVAVFRGTRLA